MSNILEIVILGDFLALLVVTVVLVRARSASLKQSPGMSARVRRLFTLFILLLVISLSTIAYAATQLNVSNSGNITTGFNLLLASPTCAGTYIDSSLAINDWSVPQGGSYTTHVCLENTGTAAHTLSIKGSAQPTGLIFSSDRDGQSVPAGAFMLVGMTFSASQTISTGNGISYGDISIQ